MSKSWKRRPQKSKVILSQPTHATFEVKYPNLNATGTSECSLFQDTKNNTTTESSVHNQHFQPLHLSSPVSIKGHAESRIFCCSFAPDGHDVSRLWSSFSSTENASNDEHRKWIATCGQDGSCRVWCLEHEETEQISECFVLQCYTNAECLRMSWGHGLTRELIATSGADGVIMLWNACDEQMVQSLTCNSSSGDKTEKPQIYVCQMVGGQSTLLVGGYDDRLAIWDITSAQPVVEWKFSATSSTTSLASSASTSSSSTSTSTSPSTSSSTSSSTTTATSSIPTPTPTSSATASPLPLDTTCYVYGGTLGGAGTQTFISAALSDGSVAIVDPRQATSSVPAYRWQAHDKAASDCAIPSEAPWTTFASCSSDGLVKLWDLRCVSKGAMMSFAGHQRAVFGVEFWDSQSLVSWSNDGSLRRWNISGAAPPHSSILHQDSFFNLHGCSKQDQYVATCGGPTGSEHQPASWNMHKVV